MPYMLGRNAIEVDARALIPLLLRAFSATGSPAHEILSGTHSDTDSTDTPVTNDLLVYDGTQWHADSLENLIRLIGELFVGRPKGPHTGLFIRTDDAGTDSFHLESVNAYNVPFALMGSVDEEDKAAGEPTLEYLRLGYEHWPGIELLEVDGYPVKQLRVDVETLARKIVSGDIDISELASHFPLPIYELSDIPNPQDMLPGQPFWVHLGQGRLCLCYRDNTTEEQASIGIVGGGGWMAEHTHTSAETGGALELGADFNLILTDDDYNILVDDAGNVLAGD